MERIAASSQETGFASIMVPLNLGAGAGPLLSGLIYDRTGSYLAIYLTAATLVTIALVALTVFVRTTRAPLRA